MTHFLKGKYEVQVCIKFFLAQSTVAPASRLLVFQGPAH